MKLALASISCVALAASSTAGMFFDGDFNDTEWTVVNVVGPAGGQTGAQVLTGGNPDMFRSISTNTNSVTQTAHVRSAWTYDPGMGAVQAIEWSVDFRNINSFGQGQGYGLMIMQNGVHYFGDSSITGSTSFEWQTHSSSPLINTQFVRIDGSAGNPNFSSGVMTFGLYTGNDGGNGITVGYDNLSINFVPEPSSLIVCGLGIALLAMRRRRL